MSIQKRLVSIGNADELRDIIRREETKSNPKSQKKNLLHFAVSQRQCNCCKVLLENHCDPNEKHSKHGKTPLLIAVENVCYNDIIYFFFVILFCFLIVLFVEFSRYHFITCTI